MGDAMKYFLKKLLGHEIFRCMVSWATKIFLENLENPPSPPPTYLMYAPEINELIHIMYLQELVAWGCCESINFSFHGGSLSILFKN